MGDIIHLTVYSLLTSNYKLKMESIYTAMSLEKSKFGKTIISDKVIKFYMHNDKINSELRKLDSMHTRSLYNLITGNNGSTLYEYLSRFYGQGYIRTDNDYEYIKPEDCLDIVYDFLKVCSPMLSKIFTKAYKEGRIIFTNKSKEVNFKTGNVKKNYIVLNKLCNYHDICVLVHELGHMYADCFCEFDFNNADSVLISECYSMYLEYYFNQYCIYNKMFLNDTKKESINFYNCTLKYIFDSMKRGISDLDREFALKYALGGVISMDTYNKYGDCSLEEIYKYFSKNNLMYIIGDLRGKSFRRK